MKKAIVFGVSGMDGKTITSLLLKKGYQVVGTYRRVTLCPREEIASLYDYDPNLSFEFCELTDFNSVKALISKHPDVSELYLLAASSHVGHSFENPDVATITNGMGVYNVLANVYALCPKARTYFAATSELFGGANPEKPYNEDSPYDCRSPYSIGKELGTRWVKYYRNLGLFVCYGILFNHSNTARNHAFYIRRVTNAAALIALGRQKELVLGNLNFWRDEHWSDFGCEMMWKMLQRDTPKDYVIANGVTHHGEEYLEHAFGHFNLKWRDYVKIDSGRFRPSEVVKLIGNSSLAQKDLGWKPERMPFKSHIGLMAQFDYELESGLKPKAPDVFSLFP